MRDTGYSYGRIWKMTFPILVSLVMEQLLGMTDTAFLGRVGEIELGASAIASVYYTAIFIVGFGFSVGSQIIIARRNGEGNFREVGSVFYHGVYFLLGLAIIVILASEAASPWILSHLVESPLIASAAMDYVRWRLVGLIFAFVSAMFRAFFVGTTQTKTLTLNSIIMVLSNVFFNWVLIFGNLGFPALGIAGAAIGSTLAELVSLIFFIVYTWRKVDCAKFGLNAPPRFDPAKLRGMLGVSVWTMIQNFLSVATWFVFFLVVEHLGERALAISNVIRSASGFLWVFTTAFGSTCSSLVSNMIGEGHQESVMSLVKRIMKLAFIPILILMAVFAIFPRQVISIYTDMPPIISESVPALWVMLISYLFSAPAMVCFNAISGTGSTRMAFILESVALVIYIAYCLLFVAGLRPPVWLAWSAESVYASSLLILCAWWLRRGTWKNTRV